MQHTVHSVFNLDTITFDGRTPALVTRLYVPRARAAPAVQSSRAASTNQTCCRTPSKNKTSRPDPCPLPMLCMVVPATSRRSAVRPGCARTKHETTSDTHQTIVSAADRRTCKCPDSHVSRCSPWSMERALLATPWRQGTTRWFDFS